MTHFPVFHPPCLFVLSVVFFFGICLEFSTFLFLIVTYLEFYAVHYPYHISFCYYSITYPAYVINFEILSRNVFSFSPVFF